VPLSDVPSSRADIDLIVSRLLDAACDRSPAARSPAEPVGGPERMDYLSVSLPTREVEGSPRSVGTEGRQSNFS
jgi:hypothetical protein